MKPAPVNEHPFKWIAEAVAGIRPKQLILYAIIKFYVYDPISKSKTGVVNEQPTSSAGRARAAG
jgi:hypothetical protein